MLLDLHPARLLISETKSGWHILALDRGEALDVASAFDPWDVEQYERALRGLFKTQLETGIIHTGPGIPSVIVYDNGKPFQAPSFECRPGLALRG